MTARPTGPQPMTTAGVPLPASPMAVGFHAVRRGEADEMNLAPLAQHRQGDDLGPGREPTARARRVAGDLAGELVAEDDRLVRPHEVLVPGLGHHGGQLVAMTRGAEVRAADSAP